MSAAVHEASHAAAAIMLGRHVESVECDVGHALVGERVGLARCPIGDRIEPSQVPLCIIGYLSEAEPGWPPPWPEALEEPREALGRVLMALGATEAAYAQSVALARDMLADENFKRLRDGVARALVAVPRLEHEDIEELARIHYTPRRGDNTS